MAYTFNLRTAGLSFHVSSIHPYVAKCCEKFLIHEFGDHVINIVQDDIDTERDMCRGESVGLDPNLCHSPDYFLESVVLLRKLANFMPMHNRLLMHGSAIAINGKGYIFTALSGTGKSTHTALLRNLHGENAVMVNDDKPFLHIAEDQVYVCGSPWMGKHRLGNNIMVPLAGIFFLRRSENNTLKDISAEMALPLLLSQCHRPSDPEVMINTLDLIDKVLTAIPLYDFGCNMDISAAELSSSVMK